MPEILRSLTVPIRTDPLEAPTTQRMAPWPEVMAFLQHLAALAEAGTAFQLVKTPGQVACVVSEAPAAPAKAAKAPRQKVTKG